MLYKKRIYWFHREYGKREFLEYKYLSRKGDLEKFSLDKKWGGAPVSLDTFLFYFFSFFFLLTLTFDQKMIEVVFEIKKIQTY